MAKEIEQFYIPPGYQSNSNAPKTNPTVNKSNFKDSYQKSNKSKVSRTENELEAIELVQQFKEPAEANVVGSLYLNSELFIESKLTKDDFTFNHWRVYFIIASDLIKDNKSLTEDNIEFYLNQHPQLAEQYKNSKGYETIERLKGMVNESDFEGYVSEMGKWNAILKIASRGFPIKDKLSHLVFAIFCFRFFQSFFFFDFF